MLNPLLLLDYRCHAEGGALGTSFPGRLTQCMRHVGALTPSQIQIEYGYPSASMAQAIRNRSRGKCGISRGQGAQSSSLSARVPR